ncbi:MAG: four helix bundle protein [Firmicutes bacterium]|nr:four helix bundle protein [Bacillota bacterium]
MKESIIREKSFRFAVRIVKLCKFLKDEKKEFDISKQFNRAGTSIGANVREADRAVSKKDFANKIGIALKEAYECEYWIELLFATDYLIETEYQSMKDDCGEINRILLAISKAACNTLSSTSND